LEGFNFRRLKDVTPPLPVRPCAPAMSDSPISQEPRLVEVLCVYTLIYQIEVVLVPIAFIYVWTYESSACFLIISHDPLDWGKHGKHCFTLHCFGLF